MHARTLCPASPDLPLLICITQWSHRNFSAGRPCATPEQAGFPVGADLDRRRTLGLAGLRDARGFGTAHAFAVHHHRRAGVALTVARLAERA